MAEWRRGARGGGWVRGGEATTDRFLSLLSYVVLLRRGVCEGERSDGYLKALGVHEEGASIFDQYYAYSPMFSGCKWVLTNVYGRKGL